MYSIAQATMIGAMTAALATRDDRYLDLPRQLLDEIIGRARSFAFTSSDSSISPRWLAHLGPAAERPILLVPYRHSDRGWFDWNPVQHSVPVALWQYTADPADQARLDQCPGLPGQGGGGARGTLVRLPARGPSRLPRRDPGRRARPGPAAAGAAGTARRPGGH
jgi:hypothetical protein